MGSTDNSIRIPDAAFSFVPFKIIKKGSTISVDPSFNLQTYANITVSKTYYVDSSAGDDGNTGLSWIQAFATMLPVGAAGDADRVYFADGTYLQKNQMSIPARSCEYIGLGTVNLTSGVNNQMGAWSHVDTHWESTIAEYISMAYDHANLTTLGSDIRLTPKDSIAEVDAAANSIYVNWVARTVYIHTFDSREPDANLFFYDSTAFAIAADNRVAYFENIIFDRRFYGANGSATGGAKLYFKDCTFGFISIAGVSEIILQGCIARGHYDDAINYDALNSIVPDVIEINCEIYDTGTAGSNQCSTAHTGCTVVRINGDYHDCTGQIIADIGTGYTWCLGLEAYKSTSGIGFYSNVSMWLDTCHSHDNATYDLQNTSGNTIYIRNCTLAKGVNDIGGTLATY